jgi:LuxR family maltose regulon positive regulatory protein
VSRPRLIERLDAGLDHKLTLLSAPAGSGKTTLLGEWLARFRDRAAWLSLDEGDNAEASFWTYLAAALQTVEADLGQDALRLLEAPQPPAAQVILTALLNEITTCPHQIILVLDDYHHISEPAIHQGLTFLLAHQPPNLHLVIATRADPPLPTYRLRARGQLTELRAADLRFTAGEAAAFLNAVMGLDLAREEVKALEARTEGWIVGLQLAALSLQGRADAREFIAAFRGGHHYVLEYLTHEVVRRQPEAVQRFLVQTSILDRLCGPLCDALTGQSDGAATLAALHRQNLFLLALDDEHRWYRYHHLFADLLGNLLRERWSAEQIRDLHLRAADWYERNGLTAGAVRHALAAPDYDRTARLIEQNSLAMVTRGELATLLRWIEALPRDVAHSRPWLCVHQAWPLTLAGQAAAAGPLLRQIESQVPLQGATPEDREILGHVAAMRAMAAMMANDMPRAVDLAHRAGELLPPDNLIPRNIIPSVLGIAHYAGGELAQAGQALAEELHFGRAAGSLWTIVRTFCDLADLEIVRARLHRAADLCHQALREAEVRGARRFGVVGYALVKLAEIRYGQNDLVAAHDHALEGLRLMQGWQQPYEMVIGYTALAAILQARGDAGALEALENAETIRAAHPHYHRLDTFVRRCRVRLSLVAEGPEAAAHHAAGVRLGETGPPLYREGEQVLLARLLVARRAWDEARPRLARLAAEAEAGGRFGHLIEILALQALAHQAGGDTGRALAALERALTLGETVGYARPFVELGAPLVPLLQQAAARGTTPDHLRGLLAALGAGAPAAPSPSGRPALVEPLTGRELQVLQLIAGGHTNQEIADALVISLNTVKKHASNVYGKLGVDSRTQATLRAQELGLL